MDQRFNLEAWKALCTVEEAGSLTAAAAKLDTEPSTVSRLIAGLEKTLGRELVRRTERPITITEDGRRAAQGVNPILKAHAAFIAKMTNDTSAMTAHNPPFRRCGASARQTDADSCGLSSDLPRHQL